MGYLTKLENLITKQQGKQWDYLPKKITNETPKEISFAEEEQEILSKLGVHKSERQLIKNIKEVFSGAEVKEAYKINFNNSRNPIEKITLAKNKVKNTNEKEIKQFNLFHLQ